jgi:hypothetical protein
MKDNTQFCTVFFGENGEPRGKAIEVLPVEFEVLLQEVMEKTILSFIESGDERYPLTSAYELALGFTKTAGVIGKGKAKTKVFSTIGVIEKEKPVRDMNLITQRINNILKVWEVEKRKFLESFRIKRFKKSKEEFIFFPVH